MHYPVPDDTMLANWHSAVAMLQSRAGTDYCLLRAVQGSESDVISCYPSLIPPALVDEPGQTLDARFAALVLGSGKALAVPDADSDARWDAVQERRAGFRSYWGEPLLWPDRQAFGCLELLSREPLANGEAAAVPSLLSSIATGIRAQLEVLHLRSDATNGPLHDELTGLAGQRLFREFTIKQIQQAERSGGELWMLQWSLDGFRELAEQLGERETQLLIRGCAEGARSCVRRSDVLARLQENRFAMLIGEANEFAATAVADRVRRTLRRLPLPDEASLSISCGLSPHTAGSDAEFWESRSAQALQTAVSEGGNRTVVFSDQD